jgi:acetoacetate decarboxylase
MSYVWTREKMDRYGSYFDDLRTHHTYAFATFTTTPDFARSVLPPCLEPADQPAITVSFGVFMEWLNGTPNRDGRDRAALIGINARHGEDEGAYYLTVIETEEVNIVTGREFWGMPKKQGSVDFFDDSDQFFGIVERKRARLIEMQGDLGESQDDIGEDVEIYLELSGSFGPSKNELSGVKLNVFENKSTIKTIRPLTNVEVALGGSPWDPGVGTIPLGEQIDGGYYAGEMEYAVRERIDLDGDGNDYAPYLMGRLYDDFPDVLDQDGRVVGKRPSSRAVSG